MMKRSFYNATLHRIFSRPFPCQLRVFIFVGFENASDFRDQGIVRVWITEERADRQENLADGEGWRPLGPQDVQAD